MPLQGLAHDIQKWHRKKTGWKVEQLYMQTHTYIYVCIIFEEKHLFQKHGHEAQYSFEWVILNDHLQSPQGNKQLDQIIDFSWFAWPILYSHWGLCVVQLDTWVKSSSISNRANNSAITFQSYKHRLATYDMVQWLLLLVIYMVTQEVSRITLAAVS